MIIMRSEIKKKTSLTYWKGMAPNLFEVGVANSYYLFYYIKNSLPFPQPLLDGNVCKGCFYPISVQSGSDETPFF